MELLASNSLSIRPPWPSTVRLVPFKVSIFFFTRFIASNQLIHAGAMLQFWFLAAVFWWTIIAFNLCVEVKYVLFLNWCQITYTCVIHSSIWTSFFPSAMVYGNGLDFLCTTSFWWLFRRKDQFRSCCNIVCAFFFSLSVSIHSSIQSLPSAISFQQIMVDGHWPFGSFLLAFLFSLVYFSSSSHWFEWPSSSLNWRNWLNSSSCIFGFASSSWCISF